MRNRHKQKDKEEASELALQTVCSFSLSLSLSWFPFLKHHEVKQMKLYVPHATEQMEHREVHSLRMSDCWMTNIVYLIARS